MAKFARMTEADDNGQRRVIDLIEGDPAELFHPDIAAEFIEVPAETSRRSTKNGQTWTHSEEPTFLVAEPQYRTRVSRVEFKMLFTIDEQVAIRMARAYDGADEPSKLLKFTLDALYDVLDDPQLTELDIEAAMVVGGLSGLAQAGLLTEERRASIALGIPAGTIS
jgi:hypothetical protein